MSLARCKAHAALAQTGACRRWRRSSQRRAPRRPRLPQAPCYPERVSSRRTRLTVTGGVRWNIQEATWNADLAVIQEENQVFVVPRSAPEGPFFCDETGFTGNDLLDANRKFLAFAGVALTHNETNYIVKRSGSKTWVRLLRPFSPLFLYPYTLFHVAPLYLLCFHAFAHSFAPRKLHNSCGINRFRTLSVVTGVCIPPRPLTANLKDLAFKISSYIKL